MHNSVNTGNGTYYTIYYISGMKKNTEEKSMFMLPQRKYIIEE